MFSHLRVKTLLIGSMLALAAIALIQGVAFYLTIEAIDVQLERFNNNDLPSIVALKTIHDRVTATQALVSKHILTQTPEGMVKIEWDVATKTASVDAGLAAYRRRLVSDEVEARQLDDVWNDWRRWKATLPPIWTVSRANRDVEAARLLNDTQNTRATQLGVAIDRMVDHKVQTTVETGRLSHTLAMGAALTAITLALLAGLVVTAKFAIVRYRVVKPLGALTRAASRMTQGELDLAIPGADLPDEFGSLARAIDGIKSHVEERARDEAAAVHAAKRDAERGREEERRREARLAEAAQQERRAAQLTDLATGFDSRVSELLATVTAAAAELKDTASHMLESADRTNLRATAVASASTLAATNVQTMAVAAEELSFSIANIAERVSRSAVISRDAIAQSGATGERVRTLSEAVSKIDSIVGLISNITSQTNLLALNATIEAARAGDAGRGFAVVASAVKALASQTARATDDISAQIGEIQQATGIAVEGMAGIRGTIDEIGQITSDVALAIDQQGVTTFDMSRNILQASLGTQDVTANIHEVCGATTSTGSAAAQVLESSVNLSRQAQILKQEIERFLTEIKAA